MNSTNEKLTNAQCCDVMFLRLKNIKFRIFFHVKWFYCPPIPPIFKWTNLNDKSFSYTPHFTSLVHKHKACHEMLLRLKKIYKNLYLKKDHQGSFTLKAFILHPFLQFSNG